MPYYVYRSGPLGIPELLGQDPGYRAAKLLLTGLRAQEPAGQGERVRMVFAANEIEAVDLLTNPRAVDPSREAEDD